MCDSSNSKYFCLFCSKDDSDKGDSSTAIKPSSSTPAKSSPPANTYTRSSKEVISKVISHFEASHRYHPINFVRERSVTLGLSSREFKYYERFNARLADIQKDVSEDPNKGFKIPNAQAPPKSIKTIRQLDNRSKQPDLVSSSTQVQVNIQESASVGQTEEDGSKSSGDAESEAKDKANSN